MWSPGHRDAAWNGCDRVRPFEFHSLWFDKTQANKSGTHVRWEILNSLTQKFHLLPSEMCSCWPSEGRKEEEKSGPCEF